MLSGISLFIYLYSILSACLGFMWHCVQPLQPFDHLSIFTDHVQFEAAPPRGDPHVKCLMVIAVIANSYG